MKTRRLAGMAEGKVLCGPGTVHIDITNGCNTNCITCWDHSPFLNEARPTAWKRQRLDLATFEVLLKDLTSLGGLQAIILSGMGEPFTHPDVYLMIAAVKREGLHLTIITNLIAADGARILELGVDSLLIGIQGASEASYLAFHPSFGPAEWERLHEMLEAFKKAGRHFKHVQVICETNAHELLDMVRLAQRYAAAQVNFKLASLREGTETCAITPSQRSFLCDTLVPEAIEVAHALGVATNLEVLRLQLGAGDGDTAPIEAVGCFMGYEYSRVLVDGTVLYCCNTDVVVGRLDEDTRFTDLWDGPVWNALRARFRRGDYLPSCRQCGKFNQNVKLAEHFEAYYGHDRLLQATGRA